MTEGRWRRGSAPDHLPGAEPPVPSGLSDLLTAVARGNERAYDAVYDLTSGWVLGVARKVLRDPAQAEEVMQEVMLEVWRLRRHRGHRL